MVDIKQTNVFMEPQHSWSCPVSHRTLSSVLEVAGVAMEDCLTSSMSKCHQSDKKQLVPEEQLH